jgi:hypothetical protein
VIEHVSKLGINITLDSMIVCDNMDQGEDENDGTHKTVEIPLEVYVTLADKGKRNIDIPIPSPFPKSLTIVDEK